MKIAKTQRGFDISEFSDRYGKLCSLQKSSLATEDAIWLGVDNTGPHMGMDENGKPKPNQDVENGRMHLTQDQVKELLPYLQKFAETGELS